MKKEEIEALCFEDALHELESIVSKMDNGQVKLEDAISMYEQGNLLRKQCEKKLAEARLKVEQITTSTAGQAIGLEPFKAE
ncbi:MAG: exodeoxyribonuclease VII small subunit [Alphaproteobacteria bacterium]|nr:exodeoxyribonuclease VII small subunit [Alphaproteobacteria bacterium]